MERMVPAFHCEKIIKIWRDIGCVVLSFAFLSSIHACGSQSGESNSEMKWGVHQSGLRANLFNLRPGQSVEICGQTAQQTQYAIEAIEQWATPIRRWGHFHVKPCGSGSNLRIYIQGSSVWGLNQFTLNPGYIQVYSQASGMMLKALLLHEIGHSWGLCDQYMSSGNAGCSYNRGPYQDDSEVMGSSHAGKTALTAGDIAGIQAIVAIDTPVNHAWRDFLAQRGEVR